MKRDECCELLERLAYPPSLLEHSQAVADLAEAIASRISGCSTETAYTGGLVHDIGRTVTHSLFHAYEGGVIARKLGLPDILYEIILTHIGGGITEEEASVLGLPDRDYMPRTIESKVVSHADNLISGACRRTLENCLDTYSSRGLLTAAERIRALHSELSEKAGADIDSVRLFSASRSRVRNKDQ